MKSPHPQFGRPVLAAVTAAIVLALPALWSSSSFANDATFVMHGMVIHESTSRQGHLEFKLDGDLDFNDAEDDVSRINGKAVFRETRDGHTHELRLESGAGGSVTRTYLLDGHEHAIDADGKRWLASVIVETIRDTGVNVDKRCKRLFKSGGADAVLAEIDKIDSDYARRLYIITMAGLAPLDAKSQTRLLADVKAMSSDFERRTAYVEIIEKQNLNTANMSELLSGVATLQSDFEKRTTLLSLVPKLIVDDSVRQAWMKVMKSMHSDFEERTVVVAMSESTSSTVRTDWALASINGINSAFERRTALVAIADNMQQSGSEQALAYVKASKRIDADFERRTALMALLDKVTLDKAGYTAVLDAVDGMGASFEIRTVLVAVARKMPADGDLIARYRQIAQRLGNFERGQAEQALAHAG